MNIDDYFLQMPRKKNTKAAQEMGERDEGASEVASLTTAAAAEGEFGNVGSDPSFLQAMNKLTANITNVIDTKVDMVLAAIKEQTTQIQALGARIGEAEDRIASVETTAESLQAKMTCLEKQVAGMLDHIDDLDNRGRRCNVRVVGLPEDSEGSDPVNFMEKWLPTHLKISTKNGRIKLDRAHRSLAPKPGLKQRPRPLVLKFHNFTDKQRVMDAARRLGADPDHTATGPRISFYNDYSAAVVKKRKAFDEIKVQLKRKNIGYALVYPATLKMTVNGVEKRFNNPEDATAFVGSIG